MSKIPSQIKKAVTGAAKVVTAPARGANLGIMKANQAGKGPLGVAAGAVKGVAQGIAHPNKVNKNASVVNKNMPGGKLDADLAAARKHVTVKGPGAPSTVNVKFKADAPMHVPEKPLSNSGPAIKKSGSSLSQSSSSSQSK